MDAFDELAKLEKLLIQEAVQQQLAETSSAHAAFRFRPLDFLVTRCRGFLGVNVFKVAAATRDGVQNG